MARVTAFQAVGRGFESRLPLSTRKMGNWKLKIDRHLTIFNFQFTISNFPCYACVAQLVEHVLGKDEVTGSIPVASSAKV